MTGGHRLTPGLNQVTGVPVLIHWPDGRIGRTEFPVTGFDPGTPSTIERSLQDPDVVVAVHYHPDRNPEETPVSDDLSPLARDITRVINGRSAENPSGTPDFILGQLLADQLAAFDRAVQRRAEWRGESLDLPALLALHGYGEARRVVAMLRDPDDRMNELVADHGYGTSMDLLTLLADHIEQRLAEDAPEQAAADGPLQLIPPGAMGCQPVTPEEYRSRVEQVLLDPTAEDLVAMVDAAFHALTKGDPNTPVAEIRAPVAEAIAAAAARRIGIPDVEDLRDLARLRAEAQDRDRRG